MNKDQRQISEYLVGILHLEVERAEKKLERARGVAEEMYWHGELDRLNDNIDALVSEMGGE